MSNSRQNIETLSDLSHASEAGPAIGNSSTTTNDKTGPLPTVKPSEPPRSRALNLSSSLIEVQLRKRRQSLSEPADDSCYFPPSQLLKDEFKSIITATIRCHHLSWDILHKLIHKYLNVRIDLQRDELGWIQNSQIVTKYLSITNELTFHNAIGVLHSHPLDTSSPITVYLWSPRPEEPFFRRTRRAPLVPDGAPDRNPEKQTGKAATPVPRRLSNSSLRSLSNTPHPATRPDAPVSSSGSLPDRSNPATHDLPSSEPDAPSMEHSPLLLSPDRIRIIPSRSPSPEPDEVDVDRSAPEPDEVDVHRTRIPSPEPDEVDVHRTRTSSPEPDEADIERNTAVTSRSPSPDLDETQVDMNDLLKEKIQEELAAPEQDEDEDDADFQTRLAEYQAQLAMREVERLQYELESEVCEHSDELFWLKLCKFFHHDPNLKEPRYVVEIKGISRKLLPVQAHGVYASLTWTDDVHGSIFVAHAMGLGKTTTALAYCLVRHKLNCMHLHIDRNPESHYQGDDTASILCPMNEGMLTRYGLDCPCAPASPTHFTRPAYGFNLVMVPRSVMKVWMKEAADCFPVDNNPFHMETIKAHECSLTQDQLRLVKAQRDEKKLDPNGTPLVPCRYPRVKNSRCIVVTTSHSFDRRVKQALTCKDREVTPQSPLQIQTTRGLRTRRRPDIVRESAPFFTAVIAQVIRDESHTEKNEGSKTIQVLETIKLLARQNDNEPPPLICLSGTPLTTGPSDLSYYIKAMARPGWTQHSVLQNWTGNEIVELGKKWDTLCRTGRITPEDSRDCIDRFRPLVEELMVRFTVRSNFLGTGPVVIVPKNYYREVYHKLDEYWENRLAQQKAEEDEEVRLQEERRRKRYSDIHRGNMSNYQPLNKTQPNSYYHARLYASFPALIDLKDKDGDSLRLTEQEWVNKVKDKEWKQETDSDPYFKNREKIFESSAKLEEIRQIWVKFEHKIDATKELARLIFCSYFFTGAYIIYLFFKYKLGIHESDLVFISKAMTQKRIDHGLAEFNYGKEPDDHLPRLLIATTASFGLGQTLNKAIGIGLLEPDYRLAVMLQTFARHTRQGNINPRTWSWLFRTQNNGVELRITTVNTLLSQIKKTIEAKVGQSNAG